VTPLWHLLPFASNQRSLVTDCRLCLPPSPPPPFAPFPPTPSCVQLGMDKTEAIAWLEAKSPVIKPVMALRRLSDLKVCLLSWSLLGFLSRCVLSALCSLTARVLLGGHRGCHTPSSSGHRGELPSWQPQAPFRGDDWI
jgi:hypothetical protein